MILQVHSDAGYNNKSFAKSRSGGHLFLGNANNAPDLNNGVILNPTQHIIKHVATSAADGAEIDATFANCREAIPLRITLLHEIGYPQPPTIVTLESTTAVGFANKNIKQSRTKTIDIPYYWLQDQGCQKTIKFLWEQAVKNEADYFSKHHAPTHHRAIRPQYVNHVLLLQVLLLTLLPAHPDLRRYLLQDTTTLRVC